MYQANSWAIGPRRASFCDSAPSFVAVEAAHRVRAPVGPYRVRKQWPQPVFGHVKQAYGFHQLLMRSFENVPANG